MAKKYLVGYCSNCRRETRHEKIECTESLAWRAFEVVVTAGWGLLFDRSYKCECSVCGTINTITRG